MMISDDTVVLTDEDRDRILKELPKEIMDSDEDGEE